MSLTREEVEKYRGNATAFAMVFNLDSKKIKSYHSFKDAYLYMPLLEDELDVPELLLRVTYYDIISDVYFRIKQPEEWINLIFVREMTSAEIEWTKNHDMLYQSREGFPPLWAEYEEQFRL